MKECRQSLGVEDESRQKLGERASKVRKRVVKR